VTTAPAATPVIPFTRMVFVLGVCLTLGTGIALFAAPADTASYWAWTIKAPLTAAFFGAGYLGAALALTWAAATREWRRTRIAAVLAFTLTSLALIDTLRQLGTFSFHDGGVPEGAAWFWLVVYVALPPLALAAFVRQELAGGAREYVVELPSLPQTRLVLGTAGAVIAVLGVLLLADVSWLTARWPWPLPPLPATVVGAWFCTIAAGLLWSSLREREWRRARIGVIPTLVPLLLDLIAAARLHDGFRGGTSTALYLAGLALLVAAVGTAVVVEERRLRASAGEAEQAVGEAVAVSR
jgi:MFS family permease